MGCAWLLGVHAKGDVGVKSSPDKLLWAYLKGCPFLIRSKAHCALA